MSKPFEDSMKVWMLLVCAARERKTYTYGGVAKILGLDPETDSLLVSQRLKPISEYCKNHQPRLPDLAVLVVRQRTDLPGPGFDTQGTDVNLIRKKVFEREWFKHGMPTAEDFGSTTPDSESHALNPDTRQNRHQNFFQRILHCACQTAHRLRKSP